MDPSLTYVRFVHGDMLHQEMLFTHRLDTPNEKLAVLETLKGFLKEQKIPFGSITASAVYGWKIPQVRCVLERDHALW